MADIRPSLSKPPLNVLASPSALRGQKPWEIDLSGLLDIFIRTLANSESTDLKLCGSVALSSAIIYRLKVESLFLFERMRATGRLSHTDEVPSVIVLPFRYEISSTTLDELIGALQNILEEILERSTHEKPKAPHLEQPENIMEFDNFVTNIRDRLEGFKEKLLDLLRGQGSILFSKFVADLPLIEKVRSFILLLFTANEGLIGLEQEGEDIRVVGLGDNDFKPI